MIEGRGQRPHRRPQPAPTPIPTMVDAPARDPGRGHRPLPGHAGAGRRPGAEAVRELGRGPARGPVRAAGDRGRTASSSSRLRELGVTVPVIGFPRGAGALVEAYAAAVPVQARGPRHPGPGGARPAHPGRRTTIQGALDPLLLRAGGPALDARVERLLEQWGGGPTSSTSATASCPTRRSPTSSACSRRVTGVTLMARPRPRGSRSCCSTSAARTGPKAVRPFLFNLFRDPAIIGLPAPARAGPRRADLRPRAPRARQANYAEHGRRLAAAAARPRPRPRPCRRRWRRRTPESRRPRLHRHALLDAVRRRRPPRRCRPSRPTRSCCCRSIRSSPPPRPPRR